MKQKVRHRLQRLPDEELLRIVTVDSKDYRPEALEVAREILNARIHPKD